MLSLQFTHLFRRDWKVKSADVFTFRMYALQIVLHSIVLLGPAEPKAFENLCQTDQKNPVKTQIRFATAAKYLHICHCTWPPFPIWHQFGRQRINICGRKTSTKNVCDPSKWTLPKSLLWLQELHAAANMFFFDICSHNSSHTGAISAPGPFSILKYDQLYLSRETKCISHHFNISVKSPPLRVMLVGGVCKRREAGPLF